MTYSMKLTALSLAAVALTGCATNAGGPANTGNSANTGSSASATPGVAEQACLRDVTQTTNNADVMLLESSFSEAGTEVIVGVGEQRARWRCTGYSDGTTTGIRSLTDEGAL